MSTHQVSLSSGLIEKRKRKKKFKEKKIRKKLRISLIWMIIETKENRIKKLVDLSFLFLSTNREKREKKQK